MVEYCLSSFSNARRRSVEASVRVYQIEGSLLSINEVIEKDLGLNGLSSVYRHDLR